MIDDKLVLFLIKEKEDILRKSLHEQLESVNSIFHTMYCTQTHKLPLEVHGQCQNGECTPGSQILLEGRNNDTLHGTIGAFLTDDSGNLYVLSPYHGFRIYHAYIYTPNEEGVYQRIGVGSCMAKVYKKNPLLDASLIKVENTDLIGKCIPLIPGSPQKVGLIGPYRGLNEELAQMRTPEHGQMRTEDGSITSTNVMKYGAKTKLTHGKLVYYDFSLPSADISGALVTCSDEEDSPFTADGDSGALIFRRQQDNIRDDVSLHEAISVHCDVLKHLDEEREVSLSFRLDVIMNHYEYILNTKLELLNIHL